MLDSEQIKSIRTIIRSLLAQCDVTYKIPPFDHDLHHACIDEAVRRGYPLDDNPHMHACIREHVFLVTTTFGYLNRPTQIWFVLYAVGAVYIDDASIRTPSAMPDIYLFNDRLGFIKRQQQGDILLDIFADALHRVPAVFQPIPASLIITSNMNFIAACLLEHETRTIQLRGAAQRFTDYLRERTATAEAFAYLIFPQEIPLVEYIQAIPDAMLFIATVNNVMSFYKEELAGESTNQVSVLAAQSKKPKLEILKGMAEKTVDFYKDVVRILEESPEACGAFKSFCDGQFSYHLASDRYKLGDLDL